METKQKMTKMFTILVLVLAFVVYQAKVIEATQIGSAWTYEGRLMDANQPADGLYDFVFGLFDGAEGPGELGARAIHDLDVIDGYFTVELDYGSDVFDGSERWLEIGVRPGDSMDPFTTLSPRQRIAPTPYALQIRGIFVDDIPYITGYPDTWTPKELNRMWYSVAMSEDGAKQSAVAAFGQIYISTDSGNTWTAKESNRFWTSVAMSADGTKQTAVGNNIQIYVSTDSGNTWTAKESNRYWNSVAMSADGTKQTAVGQNTLIYVSTDSGNTWTAKDFFRNWRSVAMSADGTKQTAVVLGGQIYVSADSGNTWGAKESDRQWASVAMSADGTKQTAVVYNGQIYVSTDSGSTWTAKESNREWYSVAVSADGTKQTAVVNNGQVYLSTDSGNTWIAKESNREWYSVAMSADGTKQTAVVNNGQIYICSADVSYSYNVGIGTSEPSGSLYPESTTLEIAGNASSIVLDDQWGIAQDDFEISNGGDKVLLRDATDGLDVLTIGLTGTVEGNVGIGTTSPAAKLHIGGTPGVDGIMFPDGSLQTSAGGSGGPDNDWMVSGNDMYSIPTGNVGIGTILPLKKLHILRPFEAATLRIEDWGDIYYDLTVDNGALTFSSIIDSNVVVLKSGRVGIGTASPEEMLHIDKSSGSLGLRVSSDAASYQYMNFGAKNGYSMGRTYDDKFFVNRDEPLGSGISRLLTVKSDGSVGIGTTDPLKKLHIYNPHYATGTSLRIENYGDVSYDITADDGALSFSSHTHDNVLVLKSGGNVGIGTTNPAAKLDVVGKIRISNSAGDPLVEMGEGLDYAEGFDVSEKSKVASGTVLIIDVENPGKLAVSNKAYDSKVAGIVAGANGIGSGVRLGTDEFDCDVALAGRVYCNVDATETAVEPGDLLTTSSMAGYAMKVTDYMRAQGAILGKAMEKLEKGKKGQILVLVTLQ